MRRWGRNSSRRGATSAGGSKSEKVRQISPHVEAEPLNVGGIIHAGPGVARRDDHRVATAPAPAREPRVQGLHSLEAEGLLKNARDMSKEHDRLAGAPARVNFVIAGQGLGAGYEVLGVALELLALDQRQPGQVASGLEVGGSEPEPAHRLPVVGDVLVCVGDGGAELAALGTLDRRRRAEREPPLQRCDRRESGGFDCSARDRCPATCPLQIDLPVVHRASRD